VIKASHKKIHPAPAFTDATHPLTILAIIKLYTTQWANLILTDTTTRVCRQRREAHLPKAKRDLLISIINIITLLKTFIMVIYPRSSRDTKIRHTLLADPSPLQALTDSPQATRPIVYYSDDYVGESRHLLRRRSTHLASFIQAILGTNQKSTKKQRCHTQTIRQKTIVSFLAMIPIANTSHHKPSRLLDEGFYQRLLSSSKNSFYNIPTKYGLTLHRMGSSQRRAQLPSPRPLPMKLSTSHACAQAILPPPPTLLSLPLPPMPPHPLQSLTRPWKSSSAKPRPT